MDNITLIPTDEGTPPGGVISPLLANIALHRMEYLIKDYVSKLPDKVGQTVKAKAVSIIRYADDFMNMQLLKSAQFYGDRANARYG